MYLFGIAQKVKILIAGANSRAEEEAMTTYITRAGIKLSGDSAVELLEQLQQAELIPKESASEFMARAAQQFQLQDNIALDTSNAENFIADLIQNDYLSVIDLIDG